MAACVCCGVVQVQEVYSIAEGEEQILLPLGSWSPLAGLKLNTLPLWERRRDLRVGVREGACVCI